MHRHRDAGILNVMGSGFSGMRHDVVKEARLLRSAPMAADSIGAHYRLQSRFAERSATMLAGRGCCDTALAEAAAEGGWHTAFSGAGVPSGRSVGRCPPQAFALASREMLKSGCGGAQSEALSHERVPPHLLAEWFLRDGDGDGPLEAVSTNPQRAPRALYAAAAADVCYSGEAETVLMQRECPRALMVRLSAADDDEIAEIAREALRRP